MKTRFIPRTVLGFAMACGLGIGAFKATADFEISAGIHISDRSDFYQPLASEGMWIDVGLYGRCWRPRHVDRDWRPYCNGSWVWTDCGWYWQSDEPWAWACYHYGGWVDDADYEWIWVPDVEWAPAWVYWRAGGDYVGWAPCAPGGHIAPADEFVFVNQDHFEGRHRPSDVIINNQSIINRTSVINATRIQTRNIDGRQQNVIFNEGPDRNRIERASGRPVQTVSITEAARRTAIPSSVRNRIGSASELRTPPPVSEQLKFTPRPEEPTVTPRRELPPDYTPGHPQNPKFAPRREEPNSTPHHAEPGLLPRSEQPPPSVTPERRPPPVVPHSPDRFASEERNVPPNKRESLVPSGHPAAPLQPQPKLINPPPGQDKKKDGQ